MKPLKFDADLPFQHEAIAAVTDIFAGQKFCQNANCLELTDKELAANVHAVQLRNGLEQSSEAMIKTRNFSIWMETGTGKTYVYLRTIFELNKRHGFTKFIIVVPGNAVKEGVCSSLDLMDSHFKAQYNNVPYDYFVYDSNKLNQVRNFAVSSSIQIMIINIDAFRKAAGDPEKENKANIIHRYHDRMLGRPIDFIASCAPVVIIDEPQSVDNTVKAKEALALLNPLCTLRYSATHRKKNHFCMMYKLDSADAYEQKLVKEIEVAGIQSENSRNTAYIRLLSTGNKRGTVKAKIEIDACQKGKTSRVQIEVKAGDDLWKKSGKRPLYEGYRIEDISCRKDDGYIRFTNRDEVLPLGQELGGIAPEKLQRLQIRETIREHLEKELRLNPLGIKVLSLFFIDKVAHYRTCEADGKPGKGKFALWFEEEYRKLMTLPEYAPIFRDADTAVLPEQIHDGYFSIDPKGAMVDTSESTQTGKDNAERGYQLIMKNKALLLSFDSPVRFIFSHSALKEGWDNPNVFQICTLNEISSDMRRRQMIGRGLRLCVDQEGKRVPGFEINTLTVIANESFKDFAENLQREIEEEENIRFGQVEEHSFANITIVNAAGEQEYFGLEKSKALFCFLRERHYISADGMVQDLLKKALHEKSMEFPPDIAPYTSQATAVLKKIAGKLNIKNKKAPLPVTLDKKCALPPGFKELWERVRSQTAFRAEWDQKILVKACAEALADESRFVVTYPEYVYGKGKVNVTKAGVFVTDDKGKSEPFTFDDFEYPDIMSFLQNETNLTRRSIARILISSGRLGDFKKNPQMFTEGALAIIKNVMNTFAADGIRYHKKRGEEIWIQKLGDSGIAEALAEKGTPGRKVKLFTGLPGWFRISTPLGSCSPDRAVLVEEDGEERLYFLQKAGNKGESSLWRIGDLKKRKNCGIL